MKAKLKNDTAVASVENCIGQYRDSVLMLIKISIPKDCEDASIR